MHTMTLLTAIYISVFFLSATAQTIAPGFDSAAFSLVQVHANRSNGIPGTVQKNDCTRPGESNADRWTSRGNMILLKDAKLAFCILPKVASDAFVRLFLAANGQPIYPCTTNCSMFQKDATFQGLGLALTDITKAKGWKFAYFLRDPLERYLSAFGSKCVPHVDGKVRDGGLNCCGEVIKQPDSSEAYAKVFAHRTSRDRADGIPLFNPHWVPQQQIIHEQCGWDRFSPHNADYIETLNGDVNSKVKTMLSHTGVHVKDFEALVDTYFPIAGPNANKASTTSSDFDLFYKEPVTVEAVASLYESDYAVLPLRRPFMS